MRRACVQQQQQDGMQLPLTMACGPWPGRYTIWLAAMTGMSLQVLACDGLPSWCRAAMHWS